ncbi:MAG: flavodoxin family protein [Lachnospiraceae bacterium]|nr:flavodoxin family protein [Lachnospiraceae bacterium]
MKKVVVFNGSPKGEMSDVMHITKAFLEGMSRAGEYDIHIINVIDKHIEYCKGCFSCMRNGGVCLCEDDMREILGEIKESDFLIFSYPLYAYGMPASIKVLVDRLLPLTSMEMREEDGRYHHIGQSDYSKIRFVMICGCGFPNSKKNFEPAIAQFRLLFPGDNTILTIPESPMFNAPEAASVTIPRLELVKKAGVEYAEKEAISNTLRERIKSPMIPEEDYAKIVNGG